jgi:hypothetical protein
MTTARSRTGLDKRLKEFMKHAIGYAQLPELTPASQWKTHPR